MMHPRGGIPSHHHQETFLRRRLAKNPELAHKLHQMALPLSPLVQLTTGAVHPDFPRTVLQFWLLTDAQLEGLAQFYHQRTPSPWSRQYPCPVAWRSDAPLEEKRRRMGRFIGLRGCESAARTARMTAAAAAAAATVNSNNNNNITNTATTTATATATTAARTMVTTAAVIKTEEQIAKEARLASRAAAADEEIWLRKMNPFPQP